MPVSNPIHLRIIFLGIIIRENGRGKVVSDRRRVKKKKEKSDRERGGVGEGMREVERGRKEKRMNSSFPDILVE